MHCKCNKYRINNYPSHVYHNIIPVQIYLFLFLLREGHKLIAGLLEYQIEYQISVTNLHNLNKRWLVLESNCRPNQLFPSMNFDREHMSNAGNVETHVPRRRNIHISSAHIKNYCQFLSATSKEVKYFKSQNRIHFTSCIYSARSMSRGLLFSLFTCFRFKLLGLWLSSERQKRRHLFKLLMEMTWPEGNNDISPNGLLLLEGLFYVPLCFLPIA